MYYDFNLNKFVFREANIFYTKDFSTNITTDGWTRVSDNAIVNLISNGPIVNILPPNV